MSELQTDETGVSEVVGVVLMVAITVLLASTAAVFFLEFENESGSTTSPTAAFETEYSSGATDEVTFAHESGDNLDTSELILVIEGANVSAANDRHDVDDLVSQSELTAGSSIEVSRSSLNATASISENVDFSEATIKLVWEGSATRSTTLTEWHGPDA
ncbi:MAG: type IV pilin [Halapricum sp.]